MNNTLPDEWHSIPETLRMEIEAAFGTYFIESLAEMYLRGVYEEDTISLDEVEHETFKFIEEYYNSRQMDEF